MIPCGMRFPSAGGIAGNFCLGPDEGEEVPTTSVNCLVVFVRIS